MENKVLDAYYLGGLFFTTDEVKIILASEVDDFASFETIVLKGQLVAEMALREDIVEQAKTGSMDAHKIIDKWRLRLLLEKLR